MPNDLEHPDQPDPLQREHPEQFAPEAKLAHDAADVINAVADYRKSRQLAEAAGIDPAMLRLAKEI